MPPSERKSAFKGGITPTVKSLITEVQDLYSMDASPWIVGYSGGKDSTAILSLVWQAISELPIEARTKPVHIISTDTLVENPVVASWVTGSLDTINARATKLGLPIKAHRLTPRTEDSFWVNLIGKGYPAPRPRFRWCTERLKIRPSNAFITEISEKAGNAILVLGSRRAESSTRSRNLERASRKQLQERLAPNASLPHTLIYTPIEDWSNDDVWLFLMQFPNPWGYDNKHLLTMYQGASADGECPLVVDSSTPSCGDSRFGCWVCTLVEKDKSMSAMIQNDQEKEWMLPLLELRNELDVADDRHLRDFRRLTGRVQLLNDQLRLIPGPYTQSSREAWLAKLLRAQKWIRDNGPESVREIQLITIDELETIRRIWVLEKHEIEDNIPTIYAECMGENYPGKPIDEGQPFGREQLELLREISGTNELHYQMVRELLNVERRYQTQAKRSKLFTDLEDAIKKGFFDGEEDATRYAVRQLNFSFPESDGEL